MTSVKKVKVALLALVAALVIAIPTSAFAGTLSINSQTTGDVYEAYQIFKGEYALNTQNKPVLSKVEWGDGISNQADALNAIKAVDGFSAVTDAASVAEVLANAGDNSTMAKAFAEAVAPYLTQNPHAFTTTNPYTTEENLKDGYYLIKQTTTGKTSDNRDGAKTRFVAQLVGPEDVPAIDAKASVPEVKKGVIEDSESNGTSAFEKALANYRKDAHYDTNEGIPYYIAGTLPDTYNDYETYFYQFTDTMSSGLTLDENSVEIYILPNTAAATAEGATNIKDLDKGAASWQVTWENQVLTVKTTDLKQFQSEYADVQVVVFYKAFLNENCVVGDTGNKNDVYLTYSNNPNKQGNGEPSTGDTPPTYAVVFTYALDDLKVDDVDRTKVLAGAEFIIQRAEDNKYAVIENGCVKEWTASEDDASPMVSNAQGKFGVKGLDAGTYTIKETKAPEGYNLKTDTITFTISATLKNEATVDGGTLNATVSGEGSAIENGTVKQTVTNKQGGTLPSTGGIGTTIFYIVGIGLILAAAITLVVRRRNATTA